MTVTDFHSHILPALDHGCADISEAKLQLSIMKQLGTDIAVATPHFYPHIHKVQSFVESTDTAISKLCSAGISDSPALAVGAEVLLCKNMEMMSGLDKLCIRGTRVLLLELPMMALDDGHFDTVEAILSKGYTVVLAHIDRYLKKYESGVDDILSMGALAQINAECLCSFSVPKKIRYYLENTDKISAIGSDLHGTDLSRYKKFAKTPKLLGNHYEEITSRSKILLKDAIIYKI